MNLEDTRIENAELKTALINASMPDINAVNDAAKVNIERILRKGAIVEKGAVVFKHDDGNGYVRIDGLKMTLQSKLELMENDEEYNFLFPKKEEVKPTKFDDRLNDAGLVKTPPKINKPDTGRFNIRKLWAGLPTQ